MALYSTAGLVTLVLALFLTGCANTILTKVLLSVSSENDDGTTQVFRKPYFGVANMFMGMALIMLVYWVRSYVAKLRPQATLSLGTTEALLSSSQAMAKPQVSTLKAIMLIAIPCMLDLLANCFMFVGIISIPASVWQMLRGANIIFCAIFSILILRRKLYAFHWLGVALALLGVTFVAVAAIETSHGKSASSGCGVVNVALGVCLVLFAQVIQAAQIILEEQLLNDLDTDPLLIVGMEGVWGVLFSAVIMTVLWYLPGCDNGNHAEDTLDTFQLIKNSASVQLLVLAYMFSCATYNLVGMLVTGAMSGVMRVMLDATRTLFIWLFALSWHYLGDKSSPFGEEWTNWSFLQAFGFVVLVLGQGTYGQKIEWPCLWYPPGQCSEETFASPGAVRAGTFPSPNPESDRLGSFVGYGSPSSPVGRTWASPASSRGADVVIKRLDNLE